MLPVNFKKNGEFPRWILVVGTGERAESGEPIKVETFSGKARVSWESWGKWGGQVEMVLGWSIGVKAGILNDGWKGLSSEYWAVSEFHGRWCWSTESPLWLIYSILSTIESQVWNKWPFLIWNDSRAFSDLPEVKWTFGPKLKQAQPQKARVFKEQFFIYIYFLLFFLGLRDIFLCDHHAMSNIWLFNKNLPRRIFSTPQYWAYPKS